MAAGPRWSAPKPPESIAVKTEDEEKAWFKAMRFAALWQESIVRSRTVSSSAFTLADKKAAFRYFIDHANINGFLPLAVAIHAWQLVLVGAQPKTRRRRLFHIPHSLDPLQFFGSMNSGKLEAEVGFFVTVNAWATLRSWFTESELNYFGWEKAPIMGLDPDELWETDPDAPGYYQDRNRLLPPEVKAVAGRLIASPSSSSPSSSLPTPAPAPAPEPSEESAEKPVEVHAPTNRPIIVRRLSPFADEEDL